jgi:hypothetical protein
MKRLLLFLLVSIVVQINVLAQDESAYFQVGTASESIKDAMNTVKVALKYSGFRIIGEYQPGNSENLAVICYTRADLEKIALSFEDRGSLAGALKIGFKKEGGSIRISMLNPMYLFYGYFIDGIDKHEKELAKVSEDAKTAMRKVGSDFAPFGGTLDKKKLQKYHYKVMMPYFKDAEELNEFASFEEGLAVIQSNLESGKGETKKVYELIYPDKKVAVIGVGLSNTSTGEAKFLPIIGDDHVAALPYEIILQGNKATILPGRFRIALHWPELTMGTFMKIMSTPGDIKNTLEDLTK